MLLEFIGLFLLALVVLCATDFIVTEIMLRLGLVTFEGLDRFSGAELFIVILAIIIAGCIQIYIL